MRLPVFGGASSAERDASAVPWTPPPPDARLAWTLRATVLLQGLGQVVQARHGETTLFEYLWLGRGWPEHPALALTDAGAGAMLLIGLIGLWRRPRWLLYPAAGWFLATAAAETWLMGHRFYHLAVPAHAVRIVAPAAAVWLGSRGTWRDVPPRVATWILGGAAGLTFLAHGWEALQHHPRFVDYLLMTSRRLPTPALDEDAARTLLTAIGALDVVVALIAALGPLVPRRARRAVLAWMAFWGALAALARVMHFGWPRYGHVLIRAANAGIPLALFWLSAPTTAPDDRATDGARHD